MSAEYWMLLAVFVVYLWITQWQIGKLRGRVNFHAIKLIEIVKEQNRALEADKGLQMQIVQVDKTLCALSVQVHELEERMNRGYATFK